MTTFAKLLHIAAIEKPQTIFEAVGILYDWLQKNGIELDQTEKAKALGSDMVRDNNDYKLLYLDSVIYPHREKAINPNIESSSYVEQLCKSIGEKLSRYIFGESFVAHKFFSDSLQMIYQFGYLPDVKQMAQELLGTPDVKLLRNFIKWSSENTAYANTRTAWNIADLVQGRFFEPNIASNIRYLSRFYGIDKISNLGKTRPDDLFLVAKQIALTAGEEDRDLFTPLIGDKVDFDTLIGIARMNQRISTFTPPEYPTFSTTTDQEWDDAIEKIDKAKREFANEFKISDEEYNERYYNANESHLREEAADRFENIIFDTYMMIKSATSPSSEIARLASDLEAQKYPDAPEEVVKKFLEYRNRLIKLKLPKLSINFDSLLKIHDEAARYHREVLYCKKIILNEPTLKFPPPLVPPMPPIITYIDNEADLMIEGESMHHCAGSYGAQCAAGDSYVYRYENQGAKGTIELFSDGTINQFYGYKNSAMGKKDWEIVNNWLATYRQREPTDFSDNERSYEENEAFDDDPFDPNNELEEPERQASSVNILHLSSRQWFGIVEKFKLIA